MGIAAPREVRMGWSTSTTPPAATMPRPAATTPEAGPGTVA